MRTVKRLFAMLIVMAALMPATAMADDDETGIATDLERYFGIGTALAADDLDAARKAAASLTKKSGDDQTSAAARDLARADDLGAARGAFGSLSKRLVGRLEAAAERGEKVPEHHVFQCPMAKPYGKWLQRTKEISNPYMGRAMPRCGKLLASAAAPGDDGSDAAGGKRPTGSGDGDGCACCDG